jgi:peptide/nickel transport system ATP-binding protein
MNLLSIRGLRTYFYTESGVAKAVDGVDLDITQGEVLGLVGESGSGKSVTAQAIMGLINRKAAQITGQIWIGGQELVAMPEPDVQALRGDEMAMIFQDPMSSLHPFYRIGDQIVEEIKAHRGIGTKLARRETLEMLRHVGIPAVERRIDAYPHQLSGGMRQRVMIAMALINSPDLLIADEPTTALDVTVQAQIMELIQSLQAEFGTTVILITHDLGIVADVADDVAVMYGGRIVELGPTRVIYDNPEMPYTLGLLSSIPRMDRDPNKRLDPIRGNPPSPIKLPKGCVFQPRCNYFERVPGGRCFTERPELLESESDHSVRCHLPHEERLQIANEVLHALTGGPTPL